MKLYMPDMKFQVLLLSLVDVYLQMLYGEYKRSMRPDYMQDENLLFGMTLLSSQMEGHSIVINCNAIVFYGQHSRFIRPITVHLDNTFDSRLKGRETR